MPDISGPIFWEPFAHWDQAGSYWRMSQGTFNLDSTRCSVILPKRGTMRNGQLFARTISEHLIVERDYSLLPTPCAQEPGGTAEAHRQRRQLRTGTLGKASYLAYIADLLSETEYDDDDDQLLFPTPTAHDAKGVNRQTRQGSRSLGDLTSLPLDVGKPSYAEPLPGLWTSEDV